jgi:hypothetical protein
VGHWVCGLFTAILGLDHPEVRTLSTHLCVCACVCCVCVCVHDQMCAIGLFWGGGVIAGRRAWDAGYGVQDTSEGDRGVWDVEYFEGSRVSIVIYCGGKYCILILTHKPVIG